MNYYKLITGYNAEEYIEIEEDELEKAYYCFLEKKDSIFSGGAVRGARIMEIRPDYHRAMGWARGYQLTPDEYNALTDAGVDRAHMTKLSAVKEKVNMLIASGRPELIGKNVDIKLLGEERS